MKRPAIRHESQLCSSNAKQSTSPAIKLENRISFAQSHIARGYLHCSVLVLTTHNRSRVFSDTSWQHTTKRASRTRSIW